MALDCDDENDTTYGTRACYTVGSGICVEGEGFDKHRPLAALGQDAVIEAVAAANRNTIVVLETGNPVGLP